MGRVQGRQHFPAPMADGPRAIIHFVGGETLAVLAEQVQALRECPSDGPMLEMQAGSRQVWVSPRQVTFIQMPSEGGERKAVGFV